MLEKKVNITTIGWWTGTFNVLTWLKEDKRVNLAALVAMSDSGGSTWVLRDEFGILPPWDVRRAVLALSDKSELYRKLFEYRFDKSSSVSGHTVGNLLITAMADIEEDFEKWLNSVATMFDVKGLVIPVTKEKQNLCVELEDGQKIVWECNIDVPKHNPNLRITNAFLEPKAKLNPRGKDALLNSDIIVIWPWDLYTSIVPNLLVDGIADAIKKSPAKVVYFCNIMTKHWETTGFWVKDFVDVVEKYIWKGSLDYVVVNDWFISEELASKYYDEENKKPVKIKDSNRFDLEDASYKVLERDLLNENDYVRHSSDKIARVISDMIDGWIK